MSVFPGAIPPTGSASASDTLAAAGHTALHNAHSNETNALATKVGTGSSTPASGLLLRGNGTGTSAWAQVELTTDVSGVLPTANGGTGNASLSFPNGVETVVGRAVSETLSNKTLTTPTIASFINANHDHTNSAGGGTLGANSVPSGAIQSNAVSFANLLSTIFSGQVLNQANAGTAGGTMFYVNLGGIKMLWMVSATQNVGTGGATIGITLPTSFFSTIQYVGLTLGVLGTSAGQQCYVSSISASTINYNIFSNTNGSTQTTYVLVIGT